MSFAINEADKKTFKEVKPPSDDYKITCYKCSTSKGLSMLAHRRKDKIVGWLFVCEECFKDFSSGKALKIEIVEV